MLASSEETLDLHVMIEVLLELAEVHSRFLTLDAPLNLPVFIVNSLELSLTGQKMKRLRGLCTICCGASTCYRG